MAEMIYDCFTWTMQLVTIVYPFIINSLAIEYHTAIIKAIQASMVVDNFGPEGFKERNHDFKFRQKIADLLRTDMAYKLKTSPPHLRLADLKVEDWPIFFEDHFSSGEEDSGSLVGSQRPTINLMRAAEKAEQYIAVAEHSDNEEIVTQQNPQPPQNIEIDFDMEIDERVNSTVIPSMNLALMLSTASKVELADIHIVMVVHGYQASSVDTAYLKAHFQFVTGEDVKFICSVANDSDSTLSIDKLGFKLAKEVQANIVSYKSFSR